MLQKKHTSECKMSDVHMFWHLNQFVENYELLLNSATSEQKPQSMFSEPVTAVLILIHSRVSLTSVAVWLTFPVHVLFWWLYLLLSLFHLLCSLNNDAGFSISPPSSSTQKCELVRSFSIHCLIFYPLYLWPIQLSSFPYSLHVHVPISLIFT